MKTAPRAWIVCYDISDEKRLRAVYRVVRSFGERLQYSVYLCRLTPMRLARLQSALDEVIAPTKDRVLLVPLGPADQPGSWGVKRMGTQRTDATLVPKVF